MVIMVFFPSDFDQLLGDNIGCDSSSGLIGTISCTVSQGAVTFTGFQTYLPDSTRPVVVNVYGVKNPNYLSGSTTGDFRVATLPSGSSSFTDYNSAAGTITTVSAPGWAVLYQFSANNLYTRINADYVINFTAQASVPRTSSSGSVIVTFPTQFSIPDGTSSCDTSITKFAPVINCYSSRNSIYMSGHTQDYSGNLLYNLRQILNPTEPGIPNEMILKTYDGLNHRIIERSYRNLDFFSFNYQYPGPLIYINGDNPVTVLAGTMTPDLLITVDYPSALNLTVKPLVPGFSTVPYNMKLSLGMIQTTFRITVPQNFPPGVYYIDWETKDDLVPAYYTPIKRTQVTV
jgi:hypothetical protein